MVVVFLNWNLFGLVYISWLSLFCWDDNGVRIKPWFVDARSSWRYCNTTPSSYYYINNISSHNYTTH
ncbi:hypothetical protein L1987_62641 [Smallanthus sonchifolius]|uniref:Uncharacterized protein n=1 Tax=Smallanthus sonchifolius TaxID=185202 RepID=A0ACB9CAZ2_9ASTR|nr:hypothetical protein L1987_62641 [Smallanthus sonchifolius]